MRHVNAFFTFVFLLVSLVTAFPTTASSHQTPPWRRLTNRIISRLWGSGHRKTGIASALDPVGVTGPHHSNPLAARYGHDIVLRFNISTADEARAIAEASEDLYLDVWEFNENWVDIRLAKDTVPSLLGLLPPTLQHAHAPLMPESALVEVISKSLPPPDQPGFSPDLRSSSKDLFFSDYQPLSVIEPWMRLLASMFPTHTRLINIGLSHEGRDIKALRVGVHPTNNDQPTGPRQTIIISGGIHSREWISTSTVNYVANQMVTTYGKTKFVTKALEKFDWVFIPTLNPDGYVYTMEADRLWRKNRQPTSLRFCRGIDLDRSFGFQWDGDAAPGNPCSESYAGEGPWQATEARRFADWARNETENNNVEFVAFVDLHSYSQQVLYPYSFSCTAAPPTLENLEELALGLAKAMRMASHGHSYKATSACEGNVYMNRKKSKDGSHVMPRIELGGGSALDWFYQELRVPYAYQVKLRDTGSYGFLLPKENIVPQGKELLSAVTYLGRYLMGEVGLELVEEVEDKSESENQPEKTELRKAMKFGDGTETTSEVGPEPDQDVLDGMEEMQWELKRRRRR